MPDVVIRPATVDDALGIATVHVRAWQETYAHLLPSARLAELTPADRHDGWVRILAGNEEEAWVAESGGEIVGWVTTAQRDLEVHPRSLELNGIYTLSRAQGTGVGQRLVDASIGRAPAFLWSAADNPRATAFYSKNGFSLDGSSAEYGMLGTSVTIVRWVR